MANQILKCLNCCNNIQKIPSLFHTTNLHCNKNKNERQDLIDVLSLIFNLQFCDPEIKKFLYEIKYSDNSQFCATCANLLKQLIEVRNAFRKLNNTDSEIIQKIHEQQKKNRQILYENSLKSSKIETQDDEAKLDLKISEVKSINQCATTNVESSQDSKNEEIIANIPTLKNDDCIIQPDKNDNWNKVSHWITQSLHESKTQSMTISDIYNYIITKEPEFFKTCKQGNIITKVLQETKYFQPIGKRTQCSSSVWQINQNEYNKYLQTCNNNDNSKNQPSLIQNPQDPREQQESINKLSLPPIKVEDTKPMSSAYWCSGNGNQINKQKRVIPGGGDLGAPASKIIKQPPKELKSSSKLPSESENIKHVNDKSSIDSICLKTRLLSSMLESTTNKILQDLKKYNDDSTTNADSKVTLPVDIKPVLESMFENSKNMFLFLQDLQIKYLISNCATTTTTTSKITTGLKIEQAALCIDVLSKYFNLLLTVINLLEQENGKFEIPLKIIKFRLIRLIKLYTTRNNNCEFSEADLKSSEPYIINICATLSKLSQRKDFKFGNDYENFTIEKATNVWDKFIRGSDSSEDIQLYHNNIDPTVVRLDHDYIGVAGFTEKIEKIIKIIKKE